MPSGRVGNGRAVLPCVCGCDGPGESCGQSWRSTFYSGMAALQCGPVHGARGCCDAPKSSHRDCTDIALSALENCSQVEPGVEARSVLWRLLSPWKRGQESNRHGDPPSRRRKPSPGPLWVCHVSGHLQRKREQQSLEASKQSAPFTSNGGRFRVRTTTTRFSQGRVQHSKSYKYDHRDSPSLEATTVWL